MLTLDLVYKASTVLGDVIRKTPLIPTDKINPDCNVYLKPENLQVTGSFKVRVGQMVSAGQPIANIGSSGNVTGPHLHFEVYVNGRREDPWRHCLFGRQPCTGRGFGRSPIWHPGTDLHAGRCAHQQGGGHA